MTLHQNRRFPWMLIADANWRWLRRCPAFFWLSSSLSSLSFSLSPLSSWKLVLLIFQLLLWWLPQLAGASCPPGCAGCSLGTLLCQNNQAVSEIPRPHGLVGISKMEFRNQQFQLGILSQQNFTLYAPPQFEIREVIIHNCNIQSLQTFAFTPLKVLKILDLSANQLTLVEKSAFYGLDLKVLRLDGNRGLQLHSLAFHGLTLESLSMKNCALKTLSVPTFQPLLESLRNLYLSDNQLTTVPYKMRPLLQKVQNLDLQANSLPCSCQILWLSDLLKNQSAFSDSPGSGGGGVGVPPQAAPAATSYFKKEATCLSNRTGQALALSALHTLNLQCGPPVVSAIYLDFMDHSTLNLLCNARGSGDLHAQLAPATGNTAAATAFLTTTATSDDNNVQVALNVSRDSLSVSAVTGDFSPPEGKFICYVEDYFGNSSYTVRIRWPPWWSHVDSTWKHNSTEEDVLHTWTLNSPKSAATTVRPYTLLHLLTAVLGTFLFTVGLFYTMHHFIMKRRVDYLCRCRKKRSIPYENGRQSHLDPLASPTLSQHHHPHPHQEQLPYLGQTLQHPYHSHHSHQHPSHSQPPQVYDVPCLPAPMLSHNNYSRRILPDHVVMNNSFDIYSMALDRPPNTLTKYSHNPHSTLLYPGAVSVS